MDDKPEFKLIVAGSRGFKDYDLMLRAVIALMDHELADKKLSIVSGMARGADQLGVRLANEFGLTLYKFPANWNGLGIKAGHIRNSQMADFADGLLAFWDGDSPGTRNMIHTMLRLRKPVHNIKYIP